MNEELIKEVEGKILEALSETNVETEYYGDIVDDVVAIGKLEIEKRKMSLEEEESETKRTNDAAKLEIEQKKAENDSEKNRIEDERLALDQQRLEFERDKAERDAKIEKDKLRNELILKGLDVGCKVAAITGLILICAAGVPLKDAGVIPDRLPFYQIATKIVGKYV